MLKLIAALVLSLMACAKSTPAPATPAAPTVEPSDAPEAPAHPCQAPDPCAGLPE